MNRSIKRAAIVVGTPAVMAILLTAANASAQDATVGVGATTTVQTRAAAPVVAPPPGAPAGTDHDMFVGHLGVGWLGTTAVPIGPSAPMGAATLTAPVVGVRYWVNSMIGVDVGVGFMTTSSSAHVDPTNVTTDGPSRTAFAIHGGVPIDLADSRHFSFQITPELEVGFGSGTNHNGVGMPDTSLSGFLLQAGARAGAEVYFGFIGIPQLALEGSVGAFLTSTSGKTTTGPNSTKGSVLTISTTSLSQPWDIFRSNIAARYYF